MNMWIREVIPWPTNLPNIRVVKYTDAERLVGSNLRGALIGILK